MKKIHSLPYYSSQTGWEKFLLTMRISLLLLTVGLLQVQASVYSQNTKFSLDVKNKPLREVFKKIETGSQFRFFFSDNLMLLDKVVNVKADNSNVEQILDKLLADSEYSYKILDNNLIVIAPRNFITRQQTNKITGAITDATGKSLPGVNVVVKGTTIGTITDIDGKYSLTNVPPDATLVFSFVGMKTQEVQVSDQTIINVVMEEETIGLAEVVAIGYGTTTKRKMSSAVSTITTEKITDAPYATVLSGLAGRTPGLIVYESGGEYGSTPTISIRGGGEPTYVIDGIVATKSEFAMIPPEDIKEISFLKDASAAAVYGMNSANGIVLVTTKKGSDGDIRITLSTQNSFQQPTLKPKYLSAYEASVSKNWAANYDGLSQVVSDAMLDTLKNNLNPIKYPSYLPYDKVVKDFTSQSRYNLALDGTINRTRVYMSLDYFNQDGIYKVGSNGLDRYSFRSNISQKFDKLGLTVDGNVSLQRQVAKYPAVGTGGLWSHVRNCAPGTALYNPAGSYYGLENPVAEADSKAGYLKNEDNYVNGRLTFTWDVPWVSGLTVKTFGNYNFINDFDKDWYANQRSEAPIYTWDNEPVDMGDASLSESTSRYWEYNLESQIHYIHTFADVHTIELTGVYTERESRTDEFSASRKNYLSGAIDELFAGSSDGKDNSGSASELGRRGYVGRVKYDFKSKYIVEGTFRYDGNDNFPKDKRWGFFPAASFGWNIDKESFMEDIMSAAHLSMLKLRGSIGVLGSDDNVTRFAYIPGYNLINNTYYIGGSWVTGFSEGSLVSNDLTWYKRRSENLGVDFGFFNGKLDGTFDWFYYRTTGYLGSPSSGYTTPLGKSLPQINTNSAHRRGGVEMSLSYKSNIGDVSYAIGGNISYFDQLWEKKYDEDSVSLKKPRTRVTHQKDYYTTGYICEGFYTSMDEISNSPRLASSTETKPGDLKYKDVNGDGIIDSQDKVRIGKSSVPHIMYGFTLDVSYKGFTLSTLLQGAAKCQAYLGDVYYQGTANMLLYKIQNDYWRPDNQDAKFPRLSTISNVNGGNNQNTSTFWLKDAWYLRMKSLSLSYDFKQILLKDVESIKNFSLVLSGTNIFTISPLNKYYMDPETSSADNYGYPVQRTYNIGLRLMF